MRSRSARALVVCALLSLVSSFPSADTTTQTLPFSQDWSNTGLITADDSWAGVPGVIGYRGDGLVSSTGVNPQTVLGESTVVDVNPNRTDQNTFTTGGVTEFHLADPVVALQGSATADAPHVVLTVSTTGLSNVRVAYNLRDIDGSADNAIQPVALQFRLGTTGNFANVPEGFVADASSGPSLATLVTAVNAALPATADNQAVIQIRIITTDAAGSDEWIGVDNINVTGTPSDTSTNPSGIISATPNSLSAGDSITVTVNVTPGTNPASTGIVVTGNLAAIGLGTPVFVDQGNNVFTFTDSIPFGVSAGTKSISATVTDSNTPQRTGTTPNTTVTIVSNSTAPTASGSASPSTVDAGSATLLTVTVTPGTNPGSTGLVVVGDLSSIGGSSAQAFAGQNLTFTFDATVAVGTLAGVKTLPISISDAEGRTGAVDLSVTVTTPAANSNSIVVISQVYGGGGNGNAPYKNDYVELFNRGSSAVDVGGWSLQYASATGTSWTNKQILGGTIAPGEYFLVALASGGVIGLDLPDANIVAPPGGINMSATAGKIALVDTFEELEGACPLDTPNPHIKDFVGYGTTATCQEGATKAPAASNTTALLRANGGSTDTDRNGSDFSAGTPNPRRTAPIVELGPFVAGTDPRANLATAPRDATVAVTFSEPVSLTGAWFDINCSLSGAHTDATFASGGQVHYITPNVNFIEGEQCIVTVFKDQVHDEDLDDGTPGTDTMKANYTWSFKIATGTQPVYPPSVHLTMGNPSAALADQSQPDNFLMEKPEFTLSYNRSRGGPNWVSWHLSDEWVGTLTRVDTFRPDPAVPPDWYRVQSFDFSGSGFDRGHMVPNADRDKETSIPINQATFLMSNMLAQAPDNNQGPWANLENYLRTLLPANELYIVAGGAGTGGTSGNGFTSTLADGHVTVPAFTWKVALVLGKGGDDVARASWSTRTIAVVMPNTQGIRTTNPSDWEGYLTTVDAVETLTGYDFFSNLTEPMQRCIEAGKNGVNPQNQTITFAEIDPHTFGDADFAITATASSGLPVTLTVVSGPATIAGNLVHLTGSGTVTVRATQAGSDLFTPAPAVEQSFEVSKAAPVFSGVSSPTIEAGTPTVSISGTLTAGALVPTGTVAVTLGVTTINAAINGSGGFSATLPAGSLTIANSPYVVTLGYPGDANFTNATGASTVAVTDTTAPAISAVTTTPNTLGAANHKMLGVTLNYSATDFSGAPMCTASVSSNEPINGLGDGNTSIDWRVIDPHHLQLRAERSDLGTGRIYTITVRCTDAAGNASTATGTVSVAK